MSFLLIAAFVFPPQEVPVSDAAGLSDQGRSPSVAYNSADDQFLVVWQGVLAGSPWSDVFGQFLDGNGQEVGLNDFVLSDTVQRVGRPAVVYNPTHHEYLVVWEGEETPNVWEIYAQRLDASTGLEVGPNDLRVSTAADMSEHSPIRLPDVAYDALNDQYLVVWLNDLGGDDREIFGRFLDGASGMPLAPDFGISSSGGSAYNPGVVASGTAHEALVVWGAPGALAGAIFGQRISTLTRTPTGSEIKISGAESYPAGPWSAAGADLAHNPLDGEYLVTWYVTQAESAERSVRAQRIAEGADDVLLAEDADVGAHAHGTSDTHVEFDLVRGEFLVGWSSALADGPSNTTGIAAVDLDGDGLDDAVTGDNLGQEFHVLPAVAGVTPGLGLAAQYPLGVRTDDVTAADLDGDGASELVFSGSFPDDVIAVLSMQSGLTLIAAGEQPGPVAVAEVTGDAFPDLLAANRDSDDVVLVPGLAGGTFAAPLTIDGINANESVHAGDVDGDGIRDLILTSRQHLVGVARGLGGGVFEEPWQTVVEGEPSASVAGDFNGDGRLDVAIVGEVGPTGIEVGGIGIMLGRPDATLVSFQEIPLGTDGGFDMVSADFDGNGSLDLAVTRSTLGDLVVLLGSGDGTFGAPISYPVGFLPSALALGDFGGSAGADLVAVRLDDRFAILEGWGDGTFAPARIFGGEEPEVYAQRLRRDASQVGPDDRRITALGPDGHPDAFVSSPSIAVSPDRALFAFMGRDPSADVVAPAPPGQIYAHSTSSCAATAASQTLVPGTPPNPSALLPTLAGPYVGTPWAPAIDHQAFTPDALADLLLVGFAPVEVDLGTPGTLLCLPTGGAVIVAAPVVGAPITLPIPDSCAWLGAVLCVQGLSLDPGGPHLTNALEAVVGTE